MTVVWEQDCFQSPYSKTVCNWKEKQCRFVFEVDAKYVAMSLEIGPCGTASTL